MSFKEYLKEVNDVKISGVTINWLKNWQWNKHVEFPSDDIIEELKVYAPKKNILELYRYIDFDDIANEKSKKLRSYTKNKDMVLNFIEFEDPMRGYIEVWYGVPADKILIDLSLLPSKYLKMIDHAEMNEVIVIGY
ncbi:MAG: hypothetical protein PHF86_14795 [Candidatus Nanoarchaeia archaeon]|jgi:hypothetical protein|nr:hypothetical protein [Candidatus Nanoarchaeia archaeon]